MVLSDYLLSLSVMFSIFIHAVACFRTSFSICSNVFNLSSVWDTIPGGIIQLNGELRN